MLDYILDKNDLNLAAKLVSRYNLNFTDFPVLIDHEFKRVIHYLFKSRHLKTNPNDPDHMTLEAIED